MTDNRTTELVSRREATTLLEEFLCGYQNILLSRGINASEAGCKQNELIDEYAERIEQAVAATLRAQTASVAEKIEELRRTSLAFPPNIRRKVNVALSGIDQAIADELNAELGSGTCEPKWMLQGETQTQEFWRCECGNCGECFGVETRESFPFKVTIDKVGVPNFCPNCGKAVKR